ncbi:uncharacterized protein KY384_000118 [Bacidia gigantensis]|uniref:uncharacterized protein n=1 Tax=Bacidia gigantensis TaxID=2732470 RepID=UPI001D0463DE|nr:uncharacterized protein KY384_000118 [Bacidia gigantensis]KAG8526125.1 hypothetical protein KY384_000118 [Bacidia gigantensis]
MSAGPGGSALVPAGSLSTIGPSFQQQGTLDWVSLGQTQFSASIAILGRLSAAGIEPLTVGVGQAVCSRVPLGIHGEKTLSEAMSSLKAVSSFGELIWFGVGISHILRTLVQTSQGASLVALCAALSEGYDIPASAAVLYEMAKRLGAPRDLSPSFDQWKAVVKVSSCVLCHTKFGICCDQMSRLSGYSLDEINSSSRGHPQDLAEIIIRMGDVASNKALAISIVGGVSCSWVAVFADFVLGLRVTVKDIHGRRVYRNFDKTFASAQIEVEFKRDIPQDSVTCAGHSFVLRDGESFIDRYVAFKETVENGPLFGSRVEWHSMFRDTFDVTIENLFMPFHAIRSGGPAYPGKEQTQKDFVKFFTAGAALYVYHSSEKSRYCSVHDFVISAVEHISELIPSKIDLLEAARCHDQGSQNEYAIVKVLDDVHARLESSCHCEEHSLCTPDTGPRYHYCQSKIAATALVLSYILGQLSLFVSLTPTRIGIIQLYKRMKNFRWTNLSSRWDRLSNMNESFGKFLTLYSCMSLFSRQPSSNSMYENVAAISDGKIYCYIDTIWELSDRLETASVIHIGAGSIQAGQRLYGEVYDGSGALLEDCCTYEVEHIQNVETSLDKVQSLLGEDTTSSDIKVEAVVEENIRLEFYYRLISKRGTTRIYPRSFVSDFLEPAVEGYDLGPCKRFYEPRLSETSNQTQDYNPKSCYNTSVLYGEGTVPKRRDSDPRIQIRPHHGNTLGRCAALVNSHKPVILINSKEDLLRYMMALCDEGKRYRQDMFWTLL